MNTKKNNYLWYLIFLLFIWLYDDQFYMTNATPDKVIPEITLTTANSIHGNITLKDLYTLLFHKN